MTNPSFAVSVGPVDTFSAIYVVQSPGFPLHLLENTSLGRGSRLHSLCLNEELSELTVLKKISATKLSQDNVLLSLERGTALGHRKHARLDGGGREVEPLQVLEPKREIKREMQRRKMHQ